MVGDFEAVQPTPLRRIIATRMQEAKQSIPHFRVAIDVEVDALLERREQFNADNVEYGRVSINDLMIKACGDALMDVPALNCQFVDEMIHRYHDADISIVIAIEGGLSTPVLRQVKKKGVLEIAREVRDLSQRARAGDLKMDEIRGGTFGISNLGMYGVDRFDAIINAPQVAMLAVGGIDSRAIVNRSF